MDSLDTPASSLVKQAFALLGGGLSPVSCCGRGAYGEVWLATDSIGRSLAVKIVPKAGHAESWKRELDGIRDFCEKIPGGLPHLLAIHHVAEGGDFFCYSMEAADNAAPAGSPYEPDTLGRRIAVGGRMPPAQTRRVMAEALEGLEALHARGLIHRDIKPDNILFVRGELKLGDIGCISPVGPGASLVGTPRYLPPELVTGTMVPSPAQDLYAMGKVLYGLLSGFDVDRFPSMPPQALQGRTARDLNAVMLCACETDPAARYGSAQEFARALEACWEGGWAGFVHRFCRGVRAVWTRHAPLLSALLASLATLAAVLPWLHPGRRPGSGGGPEFLRPGSIRTEHVLVPARDDDVPSGPAFPKDIRVSAEAGIPKVTAATLQDATVYARASLDAPVAMLATPDGQFGVFARGRATWSSGGAEDGLRNDRDARAAAFAAARDILVETFLAPSPDTSARRQILLRALSSDDAARPLLERLRTIDPPQKAEAFLRGYVLDSAESSDLPRGAHAVTVTLLSTVETCAAGIALDAGVMVAPNPEGAIAKAFAEIRSGCLPDSGARVIYAPGSDGVRRIALLSYACVPENGDPAAAAGLARTRAEATLETFALGDFSSLDRPAPLFRTRNIPGLAAGWVAEATDRQLQFVSRLLSGEIPEAAAGTPSPPTRETRSASRDGWAVHLSLSTRLFSRPAP